MEKLTPEQIMTDFRDNASCNQALVQSLEKLDPNERKSLLISAVDLSYQAHIQNNSLPYLELAESKKSNTLVLTKLDRTGITTVYEKKISNPGRCTKGG